MGGFSFFHTTSGLLKVRQLLSLSSHQLQSVDNANAMSTQELKQVAKGCLEYLSEAINQQSDSAPSAAAAAASMTGYRLC